MELTKSIGETVRKNEILAEIYSPADHYQQQYHSDSTDTYVNQIKQTSTYPNSSNVENNDMLVNGKSDTRLDQEQEENFKRYRHKILSGIEIAQERSYDKDPLFGIELLRSLAVKSAANNDVDVVKSTITGLFKILSFSLTNEEGLGFGLPFRVQSQYHQTGNQADKTSSQERTSDTAKTRTIIINPKEEPLEDTIMDELSIILNKAADGMHLHIIFTYNYPLYP